METNESGYALQVIEDMSQIDDWATPKKATTFCNLTNRLKRFRCLQIYFFLSR